MAVETGRITTDIPARMDRLPWARWHWMIVVGLGAVWILDGLEVTIVGSMSEALKPADTGLGLSSSDIGMAGAVYVAGACLGALFFGQLTDRFGRKKLFLITLGVYTVATVLTAFSMSPMWYFCARFLTGAGIGGEYAAINSAIDELIPAKYRGRVDVAINGSFWVGATLGSLLTIPLLDPTIVDPRVGLADRLRPRRDPGRRHPARPPPRPGEPALALHPRSRGRGRGRSSRTSSAPSRRSPASELGSVSDTITIRQRKTIGLVLIAKTVFTLYPKRTILCFSLFVGQAFLYNAFFFTYGDSLTTFLGVEQTGYYLAVFAISNFLGALLLSQLFDTVGRVPMIAGTYILSGVLLAGTGFFLGDVTAVTLTMMGCIIFFFASAGASAAYLTASEVFPMETRALCIAFFYAIGTAVGGITGPLYFGKLIDDASASGHHRDRHRLLRRRRADGRRRHRGGVPRRQGRGPVARVARPAADGGGRRRPGDRPATTSTGRPSPPDQQEDADDTRCRPPRPRPRGPATGTSTTRSASSSAPSRARGRSAPRTSAALVGSDYWEQRPLRPRAWPWPSATA